MNGAASEDVIADVIDARIRALLVDVFSVPGTVLLDENFSDLAT